MLKRLYSTDLSDAAWKLIARLLPAARIGGRPRTTDLRAVLNAIFYILPHRLPMASASAGIPSMGDGLLLLPNVEECGRLGPFTAHHLQAITQRGRSVCLSIGGHHGWPFGEDNRAGRYSRIRCANA